MTRRNNKKALLLYPEDVVKTNWDILITLVLLFTCIETPLRVSFGEFSDSSYEVFSIIALIIDSLFLIDILVQFNSAFYNDDFEIVDDRKHIAREYIQSWFIIDVVSIIPFEKFVGG